MNELIQQVICQFTVVTQEWCRQDTKYFDLQSLKKVAETKNLFFHHQTYRAMFPGHDFDGFAIRWNGPYLNATPIANAQE